MDFPLGWPVIPSANVRRWRPLAGGATPLVKVGDQVRPDQPVAERPAPSGKREAILAGLAGRVAQVAPGRGLLIEGAATIIQGLVGVGGPAVGPLHILARGESVSVVPIPQGAVIVFPGQAPLTLLQRAASMGAAGIIAASAGAREIEAFTRMDLTAVLDGLVPEVSRFPLTLVFTEGIGSFAMDPVIYQMLAQRIGDVALVDGATDPRRSIRPEVLLPQPLGSATTATPVDDAIGVGDRVRVTAGRWRGAHGETIHVFAHPQLVSAGILTHAVRVRLDDGTTPVVPLHFLDSIG